MRLNCLLLLAVPLFVGCSSEPSPSLPQPVVRSDNAIVYTLGGVEYPFPAVLTFDGGAWSRLEPIWQDKTLLGCEYVHSQRPRKLLYSIGHDESGFTIRMWEGALVEGNWVKDGALRIEHPDGEFYEGRAINGKAYGPARTYYSSGELKREYFMVNDQEHGPFINYRIDGTKEGSGMMERNEPIVVTVHDRNGLPLGTKNYKTGKTSYGH